MRGGLTKYYCFERRRENPPAFVPPFLFSQPVASLKDYDTRCCWGEWREELYEKFDAQKGVLTLWPWNAHGGVDEKKVFTAPRTIIFSNYSNWTFNLSLFNFAIKNEIEQKNIAGGGRVVFSSLAFDTFRGGDNEQKMKSFKLDFGGHPISWA